MFAELVSIHNFCPKLSCGTFSEKSSSIPMHSVGTPTPAQEETSFPAEQGWNLVTEGKCLMISLPGFQLIASPPPAPGRGLRRGLNPWGGHIPAAVGIGWIWLSGLGFPRDEGGW